MGADGLRAVCARVVRETAVLVDSERLALDVVARLGRRTSPGPLRGDGGGKGADGFPTDDAGASARRAAFECLDARLVADSRAGGGAPAVRGERAGERCPDGDRCAEGDRLRTGGIVVTERDRFAAAVLGLPPELGARAARAFNGLPIRERRAVFDALVERRPLGARRRAAIHRGAAVEGESGVDGRLGVERGSSSLGRLARALLALEAALEAALETEDSVADRGCRPRRGE